jgi:UDP-2-acetamido-3-amino-2,3-dideoxy-glucuronate N-acetyltransferase
LKALLDQYPGLQGARDLEEILGDRQIQGVALATPAVLHAREAELCLKAGKDVLVEKPLALSLEEARALSHLSRSLGRVLMVDHLMNRHPAVTRLKAMISAGEMGRLCRIVSRRLNIGRLRTDENVVWSFAPHDASLVLGLSGELPHTVRASSGSDISPGLADWAEADLFFRSGLYAHISVSWHNPVKETLLSVIGTERMAVFDDGAPWGRKLAVYAHKVKWRGNVPMAERAEPIFPELPVSEPLKDQAALFISAMESRQPLSDSHASEAISVLSILSAIDRSAQEGLPQSLEPFPESSQELSSPSLAGDSEAFVHPTASLEPGARLGPGVKVWNFSRVLSGSEIGEGTSLGQNVVVGPNAKIGRGCKIQNNVSVYQGVELEDEVFCGPSMVFTNVNNPRAFIKRMGEARPTLLRRGCSVGANATIVCGHTLGRYSFVAAGAVVASDVPDYALFMGVPARQAGWICRCGQKLPESLVCPACGEPYKSEGGILAPAPGRS